MLRAHLHKTSSRAQVQEQCDGVGKEPGVVTSAAKVNRCCGDKLAATYACNADTALSSRPSSTVLTPVSILRTTNTVFPQHSTVGTYFKLSQAYEAHERALSWETSPRAWLANVRVLKWRMV